MFRFNQGQLPKAFSNYFEVVSEVHTHFTRKANDYRIDCPHKHSHILYENSGPNIWNDHPAKIHGASNLYSFKRLL